MTISIGRHPDRNRPQWVIHVPVFRDRFIPNGQAIAAGIPFGISIAAVIVPKTIRLDAAQFQELLPCCGQIARSRQKPK